MKRVPHAFLTLILVSFTTLEILAQSEDDLYPFAFYTLVNTTEDALGFQPPIQLTNAPFVGENGIYCNGIIGNQYAGYAKTPFMSAMYDSIFAISVEFNPEVVDHTRRAVLVVGMSYRYIGFEIQNDTTFQILYNNFHLLPVDNVIPQANTWYSLKIIHHENNHLNKFYLDDQLVGQFVMEFERSNDDGIIISYNPGTATAFQGYWRNLRIYGSEQLTSTFEEKLLNALINIYPNPSTTRISVDSPEIHATQWFISDLCGKYVLSGDMMSLEEELDIRILAPGVYILQLADAAGMPLAIQKFVKE